MTTPKKGDLVIVREKRGAFKKDALYLAEYMNGHGFSIAAGFERLSDQVLVLGDRSKFIIEEVIPKEKLPKPAQTQQNLISEIQPKPSLYPLEVGGMRWKYTGRVKGPLELGWCQRPFTIQTATSPT